MIALIPFPDINPEIFSFDLGSFTFALRWYALAYIAGIILAWWLIVSLVKADHLWGERGAPMSPTQVEEFMSWVVVGIIVGGRLGYVLFYQPAYYLQNLIEVPQIWNGGMSFHGGFLGVAIAGLIYCRRHGLPMIGVADLAAVAAPPGLFFGRIANFVNAELWGRPTDAPWGVAFPGPLAQDCPNVAGLCARHPSQLYEAGLEGLMLGLLLLFLARRAGWLRRPGQILGTFIAGYGISRFIVEFFRQPDAQFLETNPLGYALALGDYGLTMGQILSIPMILGGLAILLISSRK